jgi:hypothetical protein
MRSRFLLATCVVAASLALGGCQTTAGEKKRMATVTKAPTQSAAMQTAQAATMPPVAPNSNFAAAVAALAGAPGTGVSPASATANAYAPSAAQPAAPIYTQPRQYAQPQYAPQAAVAPLQAQPTAPVYAQRMGSVSGALPQPSMQQLQQMAPAPVVEAPVKIRRF